MDRAQPVETNKYRYFLFIICFFSGVIGGVTSTLVPSYLPDIAKTFGILNNESISAMVNAAFIYGMLIGGIVLGYCSDRWGRKLGVQVSILCIGLFTLGTVFADNLPWLIVSRTMAGFGVGGILLTSVVLLSEIWLEGKKSMALGILSICFPVGIFSAGLITYFVNNWQQAFWVGIIPLFLAIIGQFLIKESHAWLAQKSKNSKSNSIINDKGIIQGIIKGSLIYGTMLIGLWAVFAWLPTWVQGIAKDSDGKQARGISMMIFASGGLLGGIISGWLGKIFGMKNIMLCCFAGCFIMSILLFKFTTSLCLFTYINMAFFAIFFGVSQGVLNAYIPELFSTIHRSFATGICFNISRVFTATVVFFIGWLVNALNGFGNALFIFSFVFLIGFMVTLFSKNKNKDGIY